MRVLWPNEHRETCSGILISSRRRFLFVIKFLPKWEFPPQQMMHSRNPKFCLPKLCLVTQKQVSAGGEWWSGHWMDGWRWKLRKGDSVPALDLEDECRCIWTPTPYGKFCLSGGGFVFNYMSCRIEVCVDRSQVYHEYFSAYYNATLQDDITRMQTAEYQTNNSRCLNFYR